MATWHIFGSVSQHYIQDGALPSPWSHSCYKCVHSWHWKVFWIKASSKQQAIPHPQKRHMLGGYSRCIKATGSSAGANVRLNLKSSKAQLILFWDFVNFMLQSQTQQWPLVNTVLHLWLWNHLIFSTRPKDISVFVSGYKAYISNEMSAHFHPSLGWQNLYFKPNHHLSNHYIGNSWNLWQNLFYLLDFCVLPRTVHVFCELDFLHES